jgi:uncharacterized tellurite resistance protein B-like protein
MDRMLSKKINLLLHLAKVDGKFDDSERRFLRSILQEKGLQGSYLDAHKQEAVDMGQIKNMTGKTELLYWVFKLIHADNYLHPSEVAHSKAIARQLNFKEEVVDYFNTNKISTLAEFEQEVKNFQTHQVL